jgi:AraC family ethanolamine operon transcriptional activator
MLELCRRTGASRRKLSYSFQEVLGTSPAKYLRAARLNGVRRELKAASRSQLNVQDVASRWGFDHLSQFSQDYKHLFGELPSDTLKNSRHG